jgi:hypothetical protein
MGFIIAPLIPVALAALIWLVNAQPNGEFHYGWAIFIAVVSLLFVGIPVISIHARLRLKSFQMMVLLGFLAALATAILGVISCYLMDAQGPSYKSVESGIRFYGISILTFFILCYAICGAIAAATYWIFARPDRRSE